MQSHDEHVSFRGACGEFCHWTRKKGGFPMSKKRFLKVLSLVIALSMSVGIISACTKEKVRSTTPLVAGYTTLSEKFSPFFSDTGYDQDVSSMAHEPLLTTDRAGGIIENAIEGETVSYNGVDYTYKGIANVDFQYDEVTDKTVYTWTIRDDVKFSDGELMTADDIIFTYYVFLDPSYLGSSVVSSVAIEGLKDYRTQTTSDIYDKYDVMFDDILAAGADHVWSDGDSWTQEQQDYFWATLKENWLTDVQAIVDTVFAEYISYAPDTIGFTEEEVTADEGLQMALGMALWGYGEVVDGVLTSAVLGKTWDLTAGEYPTLEDYYNETYEAYAGDPDAYWSVEAADPEAGSVSGKTRDAFIGLWGPLDETMGTEGIPNISGIKKLSDTEVQITVSGYDATAIYSLGVDVAPLHYYGDESKYNYENNKFGFDFGDLSGVDAKTTQPMGAGPYRFIKFENKVVYFEANEYYYKGEPKTYYVQFKETADADKISGIGTGTIDLTDPNFTTAGVDEIVGYNSNGLLSGDKMVTITVDNLGYGYIGMNADTINVAGDPSSEASKNLRKGLATIFSAYRDLAVDSYYGERASVINYPISNTSWAAPRTTDDGYKIAFSTAVDGSDIYTSEMTSDDKYAAAMVAVVDYFVAAGYTYDEASGKLTSAPEGAKLEYEIIVPADGTGDHPSFLLATLVKEALASIGINLIINDPTDSNVLWDKLDAGSQELWCAAWGATIDPDMYQIYYSGNIVGLEGSSESNHYHIADADLDKLIIDARTSDDQAYRKATYKACLDIIIDWAVEIPIYQRQNCMLFSAERIDMETVTPDITTFWGWMNDIEKLEMK
jgi:peptide/nickel transport system substrate-binding protein